MTPITTSLSARLCSSGADLGQVRYWDQQEEWDIQRFGFQEAGPIYKRSSHIHSFWGLLYMRENEDVIQRLDFGKVGRRTLIFIIYGVSSLGQT